MFGVDDLAEFGPRGFDRRHLSRYFDRLAHGSELKGQVDRRRLSHTQHNAGIGVLAQSAVLNHFFVSARRQVWYDVKTGIVGYGLVRLVGV